MEYPPGGLPVHEELTDVAFFPQRKHQCGPASLATVLDYRNIDITPDVLTERVYLPQREGSLQLEMVATGRGYGLLAYRLEGDLKNLLEEVANGNPVLVFQNLSLQYWPQWHYAVVVGYDVERGELVLRSGTVRRHIINFSTFERTWQRADYWAYVFVKPGEIPVTAQPVPYTRAGHDLQMSGFPDRALRAFRRGAQRWPDHSIVLMALGNAEFEAGHYDRAQQAFSRELELRADNAIGWNNLAYALANRHCGFQALEAVRCAIALEPNNSNFRQSLDDIRGMTRASVSACEVPVCPRPLVVDSPVQAGSMR